MGLPIAPNEEARQACLKHLDRIIDENRHASLTVCEAEKALYEALHAVSHMLSRMDMDDICSRLEDIVEWNEP